MRCNFIFLRCGSILARCRVIFLECDFIFFRCGVIFLRCNFILAQCKLLFLRCDYIFFQCKLQNKTENPPQRKKHICKSRIPTLNPHLQKSFFLPLFCPRQKRINFPHLLSHIFKHTEQKALHITLVTVAQLPFQNNSQK